LAAHTELYRSLSSNSCLWCRRILQEDEFAASCSKFSQILFSIIFFLYHMCWKYFIQYM